MPIKKASLGEVKNQTRFQQDRPSATFVNEDGEHELTGAYRARLRDERPPAGSPLQEEGHKLRTRLKKDLGGKWEQSVEWRSYLKRVRAFNQALGKKKTERG